MNQSVTQQILSMIDLTSLNDSDSPADIRRLCAKAMTSLGPVAAVCIYSEFVSLARQALKDTPEIKVATVVNFPSGRHAPEEVQAESEQALLNGAQEIDLVLPHEQINRGEYQQAGRLVLECHRLCQGQAQLKVILESGCLHTDKAILAASNLAIDNGADFIKTSTGKVRINATLYAAELMLGAIRDSGAEVGFKAAGGIRTAAQAWEYIRLAEQIMGADWISPRHFRFGASTLLDNLLADNHDAIPQAGY